MQSTHTFTTLIGSSFTLALLLTAGAQAQTPGPECSNELLQGWYGFGGSGLELAVPGGAPATVLGLFHADGAGNITAFRLQEGVNTPPEFMGFFVLGRDVLGEGAVPSIEYTVEPDCRGSISWIDQTPFEANVQTTLPFVLVSGGREGFAVRTEPASTFLMSFKRVQQGEQALGSQVEQLSADLAATKALLDKLAIRNSILP